MGGRGSHSSSYSTVRKTPTFESLDVKSTKEFDTLPDDTKTTVLASIDRMYSELPKLRGEIAYVDFYERPKRKIKASNAGELAHVKPYGDKSNVTLLEGFKDTKRLNARVSSDKSGVNGQDVKSVLYHEIGHAAVNRIRRNTGNPSIETSIVNKASSHGKASDISRYATRNNNETIGEAVSDYMTHGSKANPMSISIWKQLKSYLS
ncbi:MAG: hypothetical protein LKJ05_02750 [Bifidobacteriaceae bacterium]|jgi:hypothetical protein|nr:hypothetical protein [Bifidobacteriaceae bacterium]